MVGEGSLNPFERVLCKMSRLVSIVKIILRSSSWHKKCSRNVFSSLHIEAGLASFLSPRRDIERQDKHHVSATISIDELMLVFAVEVTAVTYPC